MRAQILARSCDFVACASVDDFMARCDFVACYKVALCYNVASAGVDKPLLCACLSRSYCAGCELKRGVELAAFMAVTTAAVTSPDKDPTTIDAYVDIAVHSVHVFTVLLAAISANSGLSN